MRCKVLLIWLFAQTLFIQNLRAQTDTLIEWDPTGTNFSLQFQPYYLEYNQSNALNFGMGARADFYLPKVLSFHASGKQALYDLNNYNANGKGVKSSENKTGLFKQGEMGIGLYFNYDGHARARVYAWPGSAVYVDPELKDTIYDYTKERLPCRVMIGLRGGYYGWQQTVDKSAAPDGIVGIPVNGGFPVPFSDTLDIYTTMRSNGLYFGISVSKLVDVWYKSGIGDKRTSFIRNLYIDVLYSQNVLIDQTIIKGIPYTITQTTALPGIKTQSLGARLVFEKTGTFDFPRLNFSYRFEAGVRPGIQNQGFYLMQTIGLGFAR